MPKEDKNTNRNPHLPSILPGREPTKEEVTAGIEHRTNELVKKGLEREGAKEIAENAVESDRDRIMQALGKLEAEEKSEKDPLTGLYNRGKFDELMNRSVESARRQQKDVSVLMIDMDHFKKVNDTLGHQVGDEALKVLTEILQENMRKTDTPARYGGEEFAVILSGTDIFGAAIVAEKLRDAIETQLKERLTQRIGSENSEKIEELDGTISVGMSTVNGSKITEEFDPKKLVKYADNQLLHAKKDGRNVMRLSTLNESIPTTDTVVKKYRNSIRSGEMSEKSKRNILNAFAVAQAN